MALVFKTNINCNGCITVVTPFLDKVKGISSWAVNIAEPDKILTIIGNVDVEDVIKAVQEAGFTIEKI